MTVEGCLLATVVGLGLLPLLVELSRHRRMRAGLVVVLAVGIGTAPLISSFWPSTAHRPRQLDYPRAAIVDGFVSSDACRACHAREYAAWHASYHRTMTARATPENVLGAFDQVEVRLHGRPFRLSRRGDSFWIEMDDPRRTGAEAVARRIHRRIAMTTGSHHSQIYWYYTDAGGLAKLPLAYRVAERRWIPEQVAFLRPPLHPDEMHAAPAAAEWEKGCMPCHATHGRPRLRPANPGNADAHVVELGIACEACHGPGAAHVRFQQNPLRRYRHHLGGDPPDPTIVNPSRLSTGRASDVCGQCHSVSRFHNRSDMAHWNQHGPQFRPGDRLETARHVLDTEDASDPVSEAERSSWFWPDGMVRVAGREYHGLLRSACFRQGELSCLSCHVMHKGADDSRSLREWADDQLGGGMDGDAACTQCHASVRDNVQSHTHHPITSAGSRCYNCHMPYTTFGLYKAIRSHEIDSPGVAASVQSGRPNACNLCHLNRTLAWTARYLSEWYGRAIPDLTDDQRTIAGSVLWSLRGDAGQRVLMAWSMGWDAAIEACGSDWMMPFLAALLRDDYAAVRFVAHRSARRLTGFDRIDYDYIGPSTQRDAAVKLAVDRWTQDRATTDRRANPATLTGPDGKLVDDVFDRLLEERNHRPVILRE